MKIGIRVIFSLVVLAVVGCTKFRAIESTAPSSEIEKPAANTSTMDASFYGKQFAGKKTASGDIYQPEKMTAAHRTLPFGTILRISNPATGKSVEVRVNDRGPFVKGRELDLSNAAANALGLEDDGVSKVSVEILERSSS